jgi:hypothetical protein
MTYWVVLAAIVVGGVAVWGYKNMTDKQKAQVGVGKPMRPPMLPSLITLARLAKAA